MLNAETIDKLIGLDRSGVETIEGFEFHVSPKGASLVTFPSPETTEVFSLNQFVNLTKAHVLGDSGSDLLINVENHHRVKLIDADYDKNLRVQNYAESDVSDLFADFPFERKMNQEEFIIQLMTKFVQDDNTTSLITHVSSIKKDSSAEVADDGYSQKTTVKTGVALVKEMNIKNLWVLKTYKTFPEIDQPVIPYILRLHDGSNGPMFALYDCDGGAWKIETTKAVREYLVESLAKELGDKASLVTVL